MKYTIKGRLADNTVTIDDLEDKILQIEKAGNAALKDIIDEMKAEDTGLRRETIEHVVGLYQRVVERLLLTGYSVNTGLFYASARAKGVVGAEGWNPEKNSLYVSFTQGKELREAINETKVEIVGKADDTTYFSWGTDTATRVTGATATPGRNFAQKGKNIKIAGSAATVGLKLTSNDTGQETAIPMDMIAVNDPSQVVFIVPTGLADGEYTLTLTTQYGGSSTLLKTPKSISRTLVIGAGGGGDVEEGEDPSI